VGALGITLHRDGPRYVNLAALFTLSGEVRFCRCATRDDACANEIDVAPGANSSSSPAPAPAPSVRWRGVSRR